MDELKADTLYQDVKVPEGYTPVECFDVSNEFVSAVEDDPVLKGWDNKTVHISAEG